MRSRVKLYTISTSPSCFRRGGFKDGSEANPRRLSFSDPLYAYQGAARAIEFYKKAFSATERMRIRQPDGAIGHAEIQIGDSVIMLSDEFPEMGARSPESLGGSAVSIHLYVSDVDATFDQAVAAGAKVRRPVTDQFYGDRSGGIEDPFGHTWWISRHKEDLSSQEIERRAAAASH